MSQIKPKSTYFAAVVSWVFSEALYSEWSGGNHKDEVTAQQSQTHWWAS